MKLKLHCLSTALFFVTGLADAQGTFVYDQQSIFTNGIELATVSDIQGTQPFGQSFTPALSSVGFVEMLLGNPFGSPSTIYINLRSNSITGPILDSTAPVLFSSSFGGTVDFVFTNPVPVIPGTTYYFQPVVNSFNAWSTKVGPDDYAGGTAFFQGNAQPNLDLWFGEGIVVVPEPSSVALILVGVGVFAGAQWIKRRR